MPRSLASLAAVVATGILIAGGCGDSQKPTSPSTTTPSKTTTPSSGTTTPATRTIVGVLVGGLTDAFVVGETAQMTATALYSDSTRADVTGQAVWHSSDETIVTVSESGLLAAVGGGQADVTATIEPTGTPPAGPSLSGKGRARVGTMTRLGVVAFPSGIWSVGIGSSLQLKVIATLSDGSSRDVTQRASWQSPDPTIAIVSSTGLVTGQRIGAVEIAAAFNAVSGTFNLNVADPSSKVTAVQVFGPRDLLVGETTQLTAAAYLTDRSQIDVTSQALWEATSPAIAQVSSSGLVTALSVGTATLRVTYQGIVNSNISSVYVGQVSSVSVTGQTSYSLGGSAALVARATLSVSGATRDVTNLATWQSSAPSVASVSANGIVTSVGAGSANISATYLGRSGSLLTGSAACVIPRPPAQNYNWQPQLPGPIEPGGRFWLGPAAGCRWTVTKDVDWAQFVGPTSANGNTVSGSGSGLISFSMTEFEYNPSAAPRTGNFIIDGDTPDSRIILPLYQFPSCYEGPQKDLPVSFAAAGGTSPSQHVLTYPSPCHWKLISDADWIATTIPIGVFTAGDQDFRITVGPNPGPTPRVATISTPGFNLIVTQAGQTLFGFHPPPAAAVTRRLPSVR